MTQMRERLAAARWYSLHVERRETCFTRFGSTGKLVAWRFARVAFHLCLDGVSIDSIVQQREAVGAPVTALHSHGY
jgi:hypothetical protein